MPKGKVLIIEGAPGSLPAMGAVIGFKDEAKKYPGLDIVASLTRTGIATRRPILRPTFSTRYPDLGAIFCASDEMAVAAAEAARAAGKPNIITVGIDAMPMLLRPSKPGA